jgi:hypothetical protein
MIRHVSKIGNRAFRIWLAVMVVLVVALTAIGESRNYCFLIDRQVHPDFGDMLNPCPWPPA